MRLLDGASAYGGVLHCKYFVIDRRELFVGSANLDWRALTHIHELGLRVRAPALAAWLSSLFTLDWALAGGAPLDEARARARAAAVGARRRATVRFADEETALETAASPTGWLPDEPEGSSWALPRLVALLDRARARVRVQLLSYEPRFRDARPFLTLDAALRRAADRGVAVELLLSHWSVGPEKIAALRALDEHPGIELRIAAIPPWSGGEIPFARVVHAKYAIVDDDVAWLGTSNWSGDYFHHSRNVELFIDGRALAGALAAVFDALWTAPVTTSLAAWPFEQVEPDE